MIIGIPREVKNHEYRVGLVPAGVRALAHQWCGVSVRPDQQLRRSYAAMLGVAIFHGMATRCFHGTGHRPPDAVVGRTA